MVSDDNSIIGEIFLDHDVRHTLGTAVRPICLITDDFLLSVISDKLATYKLADRVSVATIDTAPLDSADVDLVMLSPSNEERLFTALRQRNPRVRLFAFWRNFYPRAKASRWSRSVPSGDQTRDLAYSIICTPRSGSTWLAELLQVNGLGAPKEHVRPALVSVAQGVYGQQRVEQFVDALINFGTRNGIFGTKVVSQFVDSLSRSVDYRPLVPLFHQFAQCKLVLLGRESKIDQALSGARARKSGTFHIRDEASVEKYRSRGADYDFDEILSQFRFYQNAEEILLSGLAVLQRDFGRELPIVFCSYANLENQTAATARGVSEFLLGRAVIEVSTDVRIKKLADEASAEMRDRFLAEYASRFGEAAPLLYDYADAFDRHGLSVQWLDLGRGGTLSGSSAITGGGDTSPLVIPPRSTDDPPKKKRGLFSFGGGKSR